MEKHVANIQKTYKKGGVCVFCTKKQLVLDSTNWGGGVLYLKVSQIALSIILSCTGEMPPPLVPIILQSI